MPNDRESRSALIRLTDAAVAASVTFLAQTSGSPNARRSDLLDAIPQIIAYFSDGTSALAADSYEDAREAAGAAGQFTADPVVKDRGRKLYNALAWTTNPWFEKEVPDTVEPRLAEIVKMETTRPYRDTMLENRRRDPESTGWRRVAGPEACKFCSMLAAKGAVYREETVRFAAHGKRANGSGGTCQCTAWPAFKSNDDGVSASVMQYVASKRKRTLAEQERLRDYLNQHFPDVHG